MTLLKSVGRFLLAFLVFWTGLYLLADLSMRQSAALALLAQYVVFGFGTMTPRSDIIFVPHRIHVRPRWYEILTDLEIISTATEYDRLYETFSSLPAGQYNVFRDGVWFTVLDSEAIGQRYLIYSDDYHSFVSRVDFERSLEPLTLSRESDKPSLRNYTPDLFVRGYGEYALGMNVPQWWWEQKKGALSGKVQADEIFDTGTFRLTIATIPRSEFTFYWRRRTPYPKGDEVWKKRRDEDRTKFGWVANNLLETPVHKFLKHKYFDVRHYSI